MALLDLPDLLLSSVLAKSCEGLCGIRPELAHSIRLVCRRFRAAVASPLFWRALPVCVKSPVLPDPRIAAWVRHLHLLQAKCGGPGSPCFPPGTTCYQPQFVNLLSLDVRTA